MKAKHIGLILCLCIILFSVYKVYCTQVEYTEAINEYYTIINENLTLINISVDEKENNITENTPNNTIEEKKEYKIDINKLKEINKDTVGWIILTDSNINYPIVQTDNNDKYLNTTFEGKNNRAGAIYLDMSSNIDNKLSTLIIYGHNMKNGTMFRELNDLVDNSYFNNHKVFNIDLGNG